jgi:hypothetical protein
MTHSQSYLYDSFSCGLTIESHVVIGINYHRYHLAVTVTDSVWSVYVDGTYNNGVAATSFPRLRDLSGAVNTAFLGCGTSSTDAPLSGWLRDFRVYNRILT